MMKKPAFSIVVIMMVVALTIFTASMTLADGCVNIQSGLITDTKGNPVQLGYDQFGYNYQAHMFNGLYANFSRPNPPATEGLENLVMKWSDEWLSNLDCNNDHKLDRGLDRKTGISDGTSKGWVTNHIEGDYLGDDGELHHYTYFCKIVWVGPAPFGAPDPWDGKRIWGVYAIIEEVNNDPYGGFHGIVKESLVNPAGFGFYTN
jgi:hypothetical protein